SNLREKGRQDRAIHRLRPLVRTVSNRGVLRFIAPSAARSPEVSVFSRSRSSAAPPRPDALASPRGAAALLIALCLVIAACGSGVTATPSGPPPTSSIEAP